MNKLTLFAIVFIVNSLFAVASLEVHDLSDSDYYSDNYKEYSYNYHPRDRPYSIAGTQIISIFVRDGEGHTIGIPEFFPKSNYENLEYLKENSYDKSYLDEPFRIKPRYNVEVRYTSPPPKVYYYSSIIVNVLG